MLASLQPELRRILYPIFIHTFLDLMQKDSTAEAMQLMNRFKRRFREDAAFPSKIRKQVWPRQCRLMASLGLDGIICSLPALLPLLCRSAAGTVHSNCLLPF